MTDRPTPSKTGDWVTNHPGSMRGWWPRRAGVSYQEGPPSATHQFTADELSARGMVGIYLAADCPDYLERELILPTDKS